jgi:transposase
MDVVHPRCAGVDVSKRDAKVCVRVAGSGRAKAASTVTTWGSVTNQVLALRDHLIAEAVTLVVMEATGDYWKPFYYLLEDGPFEIMLVNARHVKNLPGRKTDVSDAAWLAQLGRTRPRPAGRSGQTTDALQDPRAHRGPHRPLR